MFESRNRLVANWVNMRRAWAQELSQATSSSTAETQVSKEIKALSLRVPSVLKVGEFGTIITSSQEKWFWVS